MSFDRGAFLAAAAEILGTDEFSMVNDGEAVLAGPAAEPVSDDMLARIHSRAADLSGNMPVAIPAAVTMRQAKLQLSRAGVLSAADAAIGAMQGQADEEARIEWEYAAELRRDHPLVTGLGQSLGLNGEQIDGLFFQAAQIE